MTNADKRFPTIRAIKRIIIMLLSVSFLVSMAITMDAAVGTVIYANRIDETPNMERIDESWGKPVIHVDKNTANSALFDYWQVMIAQGNGKGRENIYSEDVEFDLWTLYDSEYIYIGLVSPDNQISGSNTAQWHGDGVQIWLEPLGMMEEPYGPNGRKPDISTEKLSNAEESYLFICNLNDYGKSYSLFRASLHLEDKPVLIADKQNNEIQYIMRIPLDYYGLRKKDVHGAEFGITVFRMSSLTGADEGFAGALTWGRTYDEFTMIPESVNTMILWDSSRDEQGGNETDTEEIYETELEHEADLSGVSSWALSEVEAAINEGLVPEYIQKDWTSPITRGQVSEMFIRLLEKATGKTVDAIISEKGVKIEEGKFEDTNDSNVYAANALGIINGTSSSKFSPVGTLKRAQIAALINRVAKVVGVETEGYTHSFEDITDNYSWVNAELGWPSTVGIINGVSSTRFNPGGDLTTEQAILITYRALGTLR